MTSPAPRIAFLTYPSAFQNVGGGEILLLKVREYLMRAGGGVDLFDAWNARIEDYDILHVFGSVKDCLGLVRTANRRGVRVITTPILWSDPSHGVRYWAKFLFPAFPSARREILLRSDVLVPNSEMEKKLIRRLFAVPEGRMRTVYNGVDPAFARADPAAFRARFGTADFVLSVGRIEPRKNQLGLIRAMKNNGKRLVFIGDAVSDYADYAARCHKEAGTSAQFIGAVSHDDPLLKSAYAACRVFALQGLFETPGLAALEAALGGARLAVTRGGSTREYFGDRVRYFDPASPRQIRRAVLEAWEAPADPSLREHVLQNFTWDRIAADYARIYRETAGGTR